MSVAIKSFCETVRMSHNTNGEVCSGKVIGRQIVGDHIHYHKWMFQGETNKLREWSSFGNETFCEDEKTQLESFQEAAVTSTMRHGPLPPNPKAIRKGTF